MTVSRRLALSSASGSPFKLFDYQINAIENVLTSIEQGTRKNAVVLATGGGKTIVFSHLIPLLEQSSSRGPKTLVLAHRKELVFQAAKTIKSVNPDLQVSIDMADRKYDPEANVIVASVQTLAYKSRLENYNPLDFKTLILDECHHAAAKTWKELLRYFGADTPETDINTIGFTATYERADEKDLTEIFDKVVYRRSLYTMITDKQLCDILFLKVKGLYSLEHVKSYKGDYSVSLLEEAVNNTNNNTVVADAYLRLKKRYNFKSTIIFCVGIEHCKALCSVLQRSGVNAQYVIGETQLKERQDMIKDFLEGKIDVLCNVGVFTEGFDVPRIDSIILARPTKSRVLSQQMVGRGLRKHSDKKVCYVADVCGFESTMTSVFSLLTQREGEDLNLEIDEKRFTDLFEETESRRKKKMEGNGGKLLADDGKATNVLLDLTKDLETLTIKEVGSITHFANKEIGINEKEEIHGYIRAQPGNWVWLDTDLWALRLTSDLFVHLLVKDKFEVSLRTLNNQRFNGIHRMRNTSVEDKGKSTKNLIEAVEIAQAFSKDIKRWRFQFNTLTSAKQVDYITNVLKKKIIKLFPTEDSDYVIKVFKKNLQKTSLVFSGNLIFAFRYSINIPAVSAMIKMVMRDDSQ
ncbi:uncharacterized protein KQ657_003849 [Scheffersomyces spartinae]|uniref:Uncharacterized protein n=1 Tax=Scheffersomyces spartinae TaxID=45513 RepID=A0A9P7VD52_9ASCO|nr:uncharacterized protein KQ657_003849 [Scheffersomyces spartinae]KAG7195321.1 hypothetical protein KQ657_003849 [Scheffersomyces spartinae]